MCFVRLSMNLSWPKMRFFPSGNNSNSLRIKWSAITLNPPEERAHLIRLWGLFFLPVSCWDTHCTWTHTHSRFLHPLPPCLSSLLRKRKKLCQWILLAPRGGCYTSGKANLLRWKRPCEYLCDVIVSMMTPRWHQQDKKWGSWHLMKTPWSHSGTFLCGRKSKSNVQVPLLHHGVQWGSYTQINDIMDHYEMMTMIFVKLLKVKVWIK